MEKIADLLTKFMISESSSENLDYEVCKFGLLMAIEVAINTVIALCIVIHIKKMFEQDIVNYFGMVMYNGRHKYFDSNIHFFHVLFDNQIFFGCFVYKEDN